ncbi:hypothetical protein EFA46_000515 [Halarchaeum sp. CBA1220]|uniref:hypothetical protein n=1 Tax=Halarchaeum sp. CBA1220 TaxID=1853682 RepID=UPI000F3AA750|nr:hypothetical protein [Halarchaeum sp. CBA1220]QLC32752.1 hypothetical protein EFA46_000515 [Halarchaeum sp. CBA1220]
MRIRERLGVSKRRQAQLVHVLQLCLVGFCFVGLYEGQPGVVVNAAVGLGVSYLPAVLKRDYGVPMDPALVLWVTLAVFLHALGTVGVPGTGSFYKNVWWWDHLTHTLSSSVVAAVGYAAVRAIDEHTEHVDFPPPFLFVLLFVITLAFGVFWEVIEFAISEVAALAGVTSILTQYGVTDTMLDLVFDTAGALVVAVWGTAYLSGIVDVLAERLEARDGE